MRTAFKAKIILVLALALPASALPAAQTWQGKAYLASGGALAYTETHYLDGDERLVMYGCPDGKPFARKAIHAAADAQAPDFDMRDGRSGYREGVRGSGDMRTVYVQRGADQAEKSAVLQLPAGGVIDAGFDSYVRAHWDALARGDTLRFQFLVPSKQVFYAFDVARVKDRSDATRLTVRLSLGAWYAFLAPSIDVTYDRASKRLLRFVGVSNVRDTNLKNLNVRIEFTQAPAQVDPARIAAARDQPLAASCDATP